MSNETVDLRKVPVETLTDQQIKSRLHIIRDEQVRLRGEQWELTRMETKLMTEMHKRMEK